MSSVPPSECGMRWSQTLPGLVHRCPCSMISHCPAARRLTTARRVAQLPGRVRRRVVPRQGLRGCSGQGWR